MKITVFIKLIICIIKLKILIPWRTTPKIASHYTLLWKKVFDELKSKTELQLVWVVYMPDKILSKKQNSNEKILDIHDFKNALEIIKEEKPDLVIASANYQFIDYAMSLAAKYMNIPIVSGFTNVIAEQRLPWKSSLNMFFQNSVPTDNEFSKKTTMRRGRFFIYKYLFLLKTQFSIKQNLYQTTKSFFLLLKIHLFWSSKLYLNSTFQNSLHWLASEDLKEDLINAGFNKHSIVVTGNPLFDDVFKNIQSQNLSQSKKTRILFAPATLYEHGLCSKKQQDNAITEIIKSIQNNSDKYSLIVKIHPSSAIFSQYKDLIDSIDDTISLFHEGGLTDYIQNSDVVITFSDTSALVESVLYRKPIIVYNFAEMKNDIILERNLSVECKKIEDFLPLLSKVISNNPITDKKLSKFIKDFFYKSDGKSAQRISDAILKLVNKK